MLLQRFITKTYHGYGFDSTIFIFGLYWVLLPFYAAMPYLVFIPAVIHALLDLHIIQKPELTQGNVGFLHEHIQPSAVRARPLILHDNRRITRTQL